MGFEISDVTLLLVSGVSGALYGAHALVATRNMHDTYMSKDQTYNAASWRWFGTSQLCSSSQVLVVRASDDQKVKKNALKALGVGWLLCAGEMAANAHMGVQQKQLAVGSAVGMGVMGALCMWKGFEDKQE